MDEQDIYIGADGSLQFVYSDELAGVFAEDAPETRRASHVEPAPRGRGWLADMRPVGGPVLGADGTWVDAHGWPVTRASLAGLQPFATRQEALDAEIAWLAQQMAKRRVGQWE